MNCPASKATNEYVTSQQTNADRPEAQTNLGNIYAAKGNMEKAVAAYKTATELSRMYVPAYVNLADVYRAQGDEAKAEKVLRRAATIIPGSAAVHHALGLSLVRQNRTEEGLKEFHLASALNPRSARYIYVYAVALNSTGKTDRAIMTLQGAHKRHPNNRNILSALVAIHRDMGNEAAARRYAKKLLDITP